MGKANRLKPIHTEGTTSITTRRESAENKTATRILQSLFHAECFGAACCVIAGMRLA